jgi:hypothetical protein
MQFVKKKKIGVHPKMLDPDPNEMNTDPQPCLKHLHAVSFVHLKKFGNYKVGLVLGSASGSIMA